MNKKDKLRLIKLVHTVIWIFFVGVIFYVLYSGLTNEINTATWIAIALVLMEGIVLLVFKMFCPFTLLARKYSDSQRENFDIYLPIWIARYNKQIFTPIFILGLIIVLYRVMI